MYRNETRNIASPEMVNALIKRSYGSIPDEKPSPVTKEILERNISIKERKKMRPTPEQLLEDSLKDFEEFEGNLEEITYLSCILDDPNVRFHNQKTYEKYVNHLIVKAPDLLLKAVYLLHWLYNEHKYGHPAPKK